MYTIHFYCNTKSRPLLYLALILSAILLSCCSAVTDQRPLIEDDLQPPVFIGTQVNDSRHVTLEFSEPVSLSSGTFSAVPDLPLEKSERGGNCLVLGFSADMEPGTEYALEMTVEDEAANTHTLLTMVYGFNPDVPQLMLNEITTQGSTSNPDKVELLALTGGNTAGVAVFEGTLDFWDQVKVLPAATIRAGDYLVIHFKPSGSEEEVDETESNLECSADEATDNGWDFWVEGGSGLSGNNGVVTVYTHNAGDLMDGFLYSNRTSASDENYRGFGSSSTMEKADQLWEQGGWIAADRLIAPEDAVNPDDSTATRSMCRMPGAADTDSAADWFIVDTSRSTFGYENSTELYEP